MTPKTKIILLAISITALSLAAMLMKTSAKSQTNGNISVALSLKVNEANLRKGPGINYPVKGRYLKAYVPLKAFAQIDGWYHVKDINDNQGWIHSSLLSKNKTASITAKHSNLFARARKDTKIIATLSQNLIVILKTCTKIFCNVTIPKTHAIAQNLDNTFNLETNISGWIAKRDLWIPQ